MAQRIKVAVLMGGRNSEHQVSLSSGQVIMDHLDPARYQVKPVKIDLDGAWCVPPGFPGKGALQSLRADGREWRLRPGPGLGRLEEDEVQLVILALHGQYGEDGTIQGMLELAGIAYTGAGVLGSAMAIDKLLSKQMMVGVGIPTPRFRKIRDQYPEEWQSFAFQKL